MAERARCARRAESTTGVRGTRGKTLCLGRLCPGSRWARSNFVCGRLCIFARDESMDFGSDSGREEAILCIGGVNKDIFLKALQGIYSGKEYLSHPAEWYQFNKNLLLYYPAKDEWSSLGEYEQGARAGAALVADGVYAYIINGELKPGIRTNEINRIKENRK